MSESADTTTTTPNRPLAWVSRDARLIMLARSLRAFSQASVALLFAAYLDLLGFSLAQIGLFITIGMAGSTFFSILVVVFGELVGRRLLMTAFTLLTSVSGLSLALFDNYLLLALLTFIGALNLAAGNPGGPVQPVERASIAESVTATKRTDLFAVYTIATTSARALGTLAAGLPVVFQSVFGMEELSSFKVMFIAYAVTALIAGVLYALLSPNSEAKDRTRRITNPFTLPSRQIIFTLTTLLAIDSFATRMVVHTLVALWFLDKFGVDLGQIAFIFFIANLLNAASAWIAAKIANRWGPHLPAVAAIIALPFMPNVALAITMWFTRSFFAQMDGPTRQSYTMAVVRSEERVAVGGMNQLGQSGLGMLGPTAGALLATTWWTGAPFVASGALKLVYLTGFYARFRNIKPPEEQAKAASAARRTEA